jgi:hypothetical protein
MCRNGLPAACAVIAALEKEFARQFEFSELVEIETVGDIIRVIEQSFDMSSGKYGLENWMI